MKIKVFRWLAFLYLILWSFYANAWNANGHRLIAAIAYQHLDPAVKQQVDQLSGKLRIEYPGLGDFIDLASWADEIRGQKINLYTHWHYIDTAFSADGTPVKNIMDTDNAAWAAKQIEVVLKNKAANPFERARFLAFFIHIVGDIHQPLHGVSRISAAHPEGDEGGNFFSLPASLMDAKKGNLHQFWDGGVMLFVHPLSKEQILTMANNITAMYPASYFGNAKDDILPDDWVKEDMPIAQMSIYTTPENQMPSNAYIANGQMIVQQRIALAGYRLAALLNRLLQ